MGLITDTVYPDIINIKEMLETVIVEANTALQDSDNWFTQNGKFLNGIVGVNAYVIEQLRLNPLYPQVVCLRPFSEDLGDDYTIVTIPKIVIVTDYPRELNLTDREDTTFKPVLYPAYLTFLQKLVQHPNVIKSDWTGVSHVRSVEPGWQPADSQIEQYLDAIVIYDLKFKIFSPFNC